MARIASSRLLGRVALKGAAAITLAYILTPLVFVTWLAFFRQEIPSFPPRAIRCAGSRRFPATTASCRAFCSACSLP